MGMGRDVERELREAGATDELVSELTRVAKEIEKLPSIEPRRSWLIESKWRLMRRFDEQQAAREPETETPEV